MTDLMMIHGVNTAVAVLCSVSCALLGVYLVLRKMSLLGDAISHAILPGLALGFLLSGSRSIGPMFIGAAICGLLTAFFAQFLARFGNVDRGAALGVVFTTLFAAGVVLLRQAADTVDLDPGCVLYGLLEFSALDTMMLFGHEVSRPLVLLGSVLIANVVFITLFYKELKITSFDPDLATALGFPAQRLHYGLMFLVALTSVSSFESVGSILVVAMFVIPGATARLLTDSLGATFGWALLVAVLTAVGGYAGAVEWNLPAAGMMSVVGGLLFATAVVLAPRYGLLRRALDRVFLRMRVVAEDILGLVFRATHEDPGNRPPMTQFHIAAEMGGGLVPFLALRRLRMAGQLERAPDHLYRLTEKGERTASRIVRRHRLWEKYLVEELRLSPDHVHGTATRLEHYADPILEDVLDLSTRGATTDPHGRAIPTVPESKPQNDRKA